jgi:hypothetical protein
MSPERAKETEAARNGGFPIFHHWRHPEPGFSRVKDLARSGSY